MLSLAIINDIEKDIKPEFIYALQSRDTDIFYWSEKGKPESLQKLRPTG